MNKALISKIAVGAGVTVAGMFAWEGLVRPFLIKQGWLR